MNRTNSVLIGALLLGVMLGSAHGPRAIGQPADPPEFFLVDDQHLPHACISWPTRSGSTTTLEAERAYLSPVERTPLAQNIQAYVALGGTRLDRAAGHPDGAIVRVGFYKTDAKKPFFEDIADDAVVTVRLIGVRFNQPAGALHESALQHIKFMADDLVACGLGGETLDQFNTVSHVDTLNKKLTPDNARMGALDGRSSAGGSIELRNEADGSITMEAKFPYAFLRHVKDPWVRTKPGTFTEPQHFHVEFEVLPKASADAEEAAAPKTEPNAAAPAPPPAVGPVSDPKGPGVPLP